MAAAVSGERRESLGARHKSTSFNFGMNRDHRRTDQQTRSPRTTASSSSIIPAATSSTSTSSPLQPAASSFLDTQTQDKNLPSAKMEQSQHSLSPSRRVDDRNIHEWRYPRQTETFNKRRNSQRSLSRPRSQQGSAIDAVKEADREVVQMQEVSSAEQSASNDFLPRKAAKYDHQRHQKNRSSGGDSSSRGGGGDGGGGGEDNFNRSNAIEWSRKGDAAVPRLNDFEPTTTSSSRLQVSHSRTSSGEAEGEESARQPSADQGLAKSMMSMAEFDDENPSSNYTWRSRKEEEKHRESVEAAEARSEGSATSGTTRLPSVNATFPSMTAPPLTSAASYKRNNSSPSPRLPHFASLQPKVSTSTSSSSHQQRPLDERESSPMNPRQMASSGSYGVQQRYVSPRLASALSPSSLSQQQLTPGHAFIHPALAGLPGAGGIAGSKQQPSFVSKLYSMLEDDTIEDMIAWGPSGTVFSVANPAEFSKVVLPNWFKHSNWQSFVRQLNMYGFHKVNHTYQGTPEEEIQVWEFKHPSFRRGEIQLLNDIKRKSSRHKRQGSLIQGMTNVGDYDGMGGRSPGSATPSPEIPLSHLGPPPNPSAARSGMPPSQQQQQQQLHQHNQLHHRQHSRSIGSASGFPPYREYAHQVAMEGPPPPPRHHHQHGMPSTSSSKVFATPHHGGEMMRDEMSGGMISSESASARMDDLSDRIDAIIRHASYLESQLRSVSDQLYQSQQNEMNLSRHVQEMEIQIRSLEEVLQGRSVMSAASSIKRQGSPTLLLSLPATQLQSSTAKMSSGIPSSSTRTNYPNRSPLDTHPSYSSSFTRGGASNLLSHSSADAYQKLPPPPSPSGRRGGEDAQSAAADVGEKRYRN
ncbi:hypothetical protein CBS101457_003954 [Exobasidium rhododendri]|nr:hypothetical protein CBS101457_003954 [Exobasidium rhododendri]